MTVEDKQSHLPLRRPGVEADGAEAHPRPDGRHRQHEPGAQECEAVRLLLISCQDYPRVILIELRQALVSYQDYHMVF